MRIGLIPLDERPVNTRYPLMLAEIGGIDLAIPPASVLSRIRQPANTATLAEWMKSNMGAVDVLIASVEMLAYGGLIASRTTDTAVLDVLAALQNALTSASASALYAFNVVTRISNADYNIEEPLYWDRFGTRLYRYSQLLHRRAEGQQVESDIAELRSAIPSEYIADFMHRRLRNHQLNLHLMQLAASDALDLLILSSDDTSAYGLGSQEKWWLETWARRLELDHNRLLMYPGADEVGCVLLARAVTRDALATRFYVHYAIPEGAERTAPYEDGPVKITVARQLMAAGGAYVDTISDADYVVAVNPPSPIDREFDPDRAAEERRQRLPYLERFVEEIDRWLERGKRVIVCDVAYPNGSDPVLIELMCARLDLTQLAAYGAWNTAGNTIGTAIAQGIMSSAMSTERQRRAQERFLLHRFLEDWGYQHLVRQQVRDSLARETGMPEVTADTMSSTLNHVESSLNSLISTLPGFAGRWRIVPGSTAFPWQRTFEVDFDLEMVL